MSVEVLFIDEEPESMSGWLPLEGVNFDSPTEDIRKAMEGEYGPFEAQPTEQNPCRRGEYWDFVEKATGPEVRCFMAYHRSRGFWILVRK